MKKLTGILLALGLCLTVGACSNEEKEQKENRTIYVHEYCSGSIRGNYCSGVTRYSEQIKEKDIYKIDTVSISATESGGYIHAHYVVYHYEEGLD